MLRTFDPRESEPSVTAASPQSASRGESRRPRAHRAGVVVISALTPLLFLATDALAQVCIGLPAEQGRISVQLEATASDADPSYGGRLGMNFNTPFTLESEIHRPRGDHGIGTSVTAGFAYEMLVYEPAMCPVAGLQYETRPVADGGNVTTWTMPLGFGVGRRLGSARALSLSIFARPEYLYVLDREGPDGEAEFDGLGDRSEARGTLGLVLATPFVFATGAVEVGTVDDYDPRFTVGIGMTF